jgi:hypothetical protein
MIKEITNESQKHGIRRSNTGRGKLKKASKKGE